MRSMGSYGPKLSSCGQRRLRSDWANAQAHLSLRWAHMPFCWFCHEAAHFSNAKFRNFMRMSIYYFSRLCLLFPCIVLLIRLVGSLTLTKFEVSMGHIQ